MSSKHNKAARYCKGFTGGTRFLLRCLCDRASAGQKDGKRKLPPFGWTPPVTDTLLMQELGTKRRESLRQWRKELVGAGVIKIEWIKVAKDKFPVHRYFVDLAWLEANTVQRKTLHASDNTRAAKNEFPGHEKRCTQNSENAALERTPSESGDARTSGVRPSGSSEALPEGKKEGRKEGSVASLPPVEPPAENPEEKPLDSGTKEPTDTERMGFHLQMFIGQETVLENGVWRHGTREDLLTLLFDWKGLTGIWPGNGDDDALAYEAMAWLSNKFGHPDELRAQFLLILRECPKTAGVAWKDFTYFCKNYERTLRNAKAWERKQQAALKQKLNQCLDCAPNQPCQKHRDKLLEVGA